MRRATSCCGRSRPCCWWACAFAFRWRGWAALNSACCSPIARPPDKAIALTEAIIAQIRDHRFVWEGQAFHIGASIGIVPIGAYAPAAPDLMRQADLACYSAKHGGRNRAYLWEERAQAGGVLGLEDVRAALHGNRIQIEYQRMAPLAPQRHLPEHYELYSRLMNAAGERTLPGVFIPAAERYQTMDRIDRWVIRAALAE